MKQQKTITLPPMTVSNFIHGPLREYSIYVVKHRGLPSFTDGFKTVSRKLFWMMQKQNGEVKVSALSGRAADKANYHHGDCSGSIVTMTQDFPGTNNVPYFIGRGEFGSVQQKSSSAPRYIFCTYNKIMNLIYLDKDLFESCDDIEDPEPKNFFPIIPMLLVNNQSGIATGHACKFQSFHPLDVLKLTRHILNTPDDVENMPMLTPYLNGFKGKIEYNDEKERWESFGKWNQENTTSIRISEVPTTFSRLSYLKYLVLLKNKKHITRYVEETIDGTDNWNIIVKLPKTSKVWEDPIRMLNLRRTLPMNMSCLSENDTVLKFEHPEEIAIKFVFYRIGIYKDRIIYQIDRIIKDIKWNEEKINFVKVLSNVDFKNMSSNEIKEYCNSKGIIKNLDKLMKLPISRLNKSGINAYEDMIVKLEEEKKYYMAHSPIDLYNIDLDNLEKEINKIKG